MSDKTLTPEDLNEFRLRRTAVERAILTSNMLQESYNSWCQRMKQRYEMDGAFNVNVKTGELVLVEDESDG